MRAVALVFMVLVAACGTSDSGDKPMSTKTFGGDRPADLHTPTKLTPGKQYPLVVLLHGFGASGFAQSAFFHMQALTDADAALWIAPDGTTNSTGQQFWNADPACCDFEHKNPDDVGYLTKLVDDIVAEWPIDVSQIFFIGHSNGGYMSYRMACERADKIAAIMSLAGNAASVASTCNPSRPVSVLHLHGTADTTVPYSASGTGAVENVTQWALHDNCGTSRSSTVTLDLDTSVTGAETHGETTVDCPSRIAVDLWTLEGSSHIPLLANDFATTIFGWLSAHKR